MGRPKSNNTKVLHELFAAYEEKLIDEDKVVAPKADVWIWLRNKLKNHYVNLNEKTIYSAALRWWKDKNCVEKPLLESELLNEFEMSAGTSTETSLNSSNERMLNSQVAKFSIKLSNSVWKTIEPVELTYRRKDTVKGVRTYFALQPDVWSNVLVDSIAEKKDILCAWSFKNNKYCDGKVTIQASCTTCSANLFGVIKKIPDENEPVTINVEIHGLNLRRHLMSANRNVKIVGQKANDLVASGKPAIAIRRETMAKSASVFKKPTGRVVSANALRCSRYRRNVKQKLSPCTYTSLEYLKWSSKYMNCIHQISMDPFIVSYTTPDQLKLYAAYKKKNSYTKISGDSTGGVVRKLERPGGRKSKQILLSTLVISDGFQVPVGSTISEKNKGNFLTLWLSEWVDMTQDIPNQFTCDMSKAFLNAACRSFALSPSVAAYIDLMFNIAKGDIKIMPLCYVRIDIAHLIKNVTACDALKTSRKKVRDFYIRCVALLLQTDNIEEAENLIRCVLIVANSSTEGHSEDGVPVICETSKTHIIRKITGEISNEVQLFIERDSNEEKNDYEDDEIEIKSDEVDVSNTSLNLWLKDIIKEVKEKLEAEDNGDRDNIMYNLAFSKYFMELCKMLPLWSGICFKYFKGAELISTSANVESYFNDMKLCHRDIIPCSADRFVEEDLKLINGMIIDASQNYIEYVADLTFNSVNMNDVTNKINDETNMETNDVTDTTNDETNMEINDITNTINNETNMETNNITYITNDDTNMDDITDPTNADTNMDDITDPTNADMNWILHTSNKVKHIVTEDDSVRITKKMNCPACANNDQPSGAHTCWKCGKNVHILEGCSISCGDEEGYGERRLCATCSLKKSVPESFVATAIKNKNKTEKRSNKSVPDSLVTTAIREMNNKENWNRKPKRKTKQSKYTSSAPNGHLNTNIDKKVKIGILLNGNLSSTLYKVDQKLVALKNTCAFDSIAQILAAAYAYVPSFRNYMENSTDEVFQIAIALGKNEHMTKINNMRAKLLYTPFKRTLCQIVSTCIIKDLFQHTPSYIEVNRCDQCKASVDASFFTVLVNNKIFDNNLTKLEESITKNLAKQSYCQPCKRIAKITNRHFQSHLFIELPNCGNNYSDFEPSRVHKLTNIPVTLTIQEKKYVLFGALLFIPPYLDGDIGHYFAAVKINDNWEAFDDMRSKSRPISKTSNVVIHNLFYISEV